MPLHQQTKQIAAFLLLLVLSGCGVATDKASPPEAAKTPAESAKTPPVVVMEPDHVAEFTAILNDPGFRKRRSSGFGYAAKLKLKSLPCMRFDRRYSPPSFDVVKTNSLVSPYDAKVALTETRVLS